MFIIINIIRYLGYSFCLMATPILHIGIILLKKSDDLEDRFE